MVGDLAVFVLVDLSCCLFEMSGQTEEQSPVRPARLGLDCRSGVRLAGNLLLVWSYWQWQGLRGEALYHVLGGKPDELAFTINGYLCVKGQGGAIGEVESACRNKRMVVFSEVASHTALKDTLLKSLSEHAGLPAASCRSMQRMVNWQSAATLWMTSNYAPCHQDDALTAKLNVIAVPQVSTAQPTGFQCANEDLKVLADRAHTCCG